MATSNEAASDPKRYAVDFFCVTKNGNRRTTFLREVLERYSGGHAPAIELEQGVDEKYQIRSIQASRTGKVYAAVFGRCRYGETPEQTSEDGVESDVELKPGHGLVEKNHFLFFTDLNLVVYQRNGSGSSSAKFQRYLNRPAYINVSMEPVLTQDSYERLLQGGGLKKVELSIARPHLQPDSGEQLIQEAIALFGTTDAGRLKITLSADRNRTLSETLRTPIAVLAKLDRTRVARVHLEGENEAVEVIDLIGDRIRGTITVPLEQNGRPTAASVFRALAEVKDAKREDLRAFFG